MRQLTMFDIEAARRTRGHTALLFLTDRCPVGCAHCSVDSRKDSPKIRDFALFEQIVDALCASSYRLFGISGGEPFVERRGLGLATERLQAAGKAVSIVTSGVWATGDEAPAWIKPVLRRCGCIVLSTDVFHTVALSDETFIQAARSIANEGVWVVAQTIEDKANPGRAEALLERTFGPGWSEYAEVHRVPLLSRGRATDLFQPVAAFTGRDFGPCYIARSPVIRYDGTMSVCCNEAVIMGRGPESLRRRCGDGAQVAEALVELDRHAYFRAVADIGPGALTADPRFVDLADSRYRSICELCWSMVDRVEAGGATDPVFIATAELLTRRPA